MNSAFVITSWNEDGIHSWFIEFVISINIHRVREKAMLYAELPGLSRYTNTFNRPKLDLQHFLLRNESEYCSFIFFVDAKVECKQALYISKKNSTWYFMGAHYVYWFRAKKKLSFSCKYLHWIINEIFIICSGYVVN